MALGVPVKCGSIVLHAFPGAETLPRRRRPHIACGRLERKQACHTAPGADALYAAASMSMLEERPSPDAAEILCGIKGIGPGRLLSFCCAG